MDEAIACYRKAIELDPKLATAHINLGTALKDKGQLDEAIACYKKAIELDPKYAIAHNNLGAILCDVKRDYDAAIACFRKAIELDPKHAAAHANLGIALKDKGQVDEAIACYKKAIELDPKWAVAQTLLAQAERMAAGQDKFADFQNGSYTPASNDERLGLAEVVRDQEANQYAATSLYAAAFAADPKLADDLKAGHRYNAACFASLAAAGQGEDAAKLDNAERTRLRKQALDWLRADLALRTKQLETGKPADRAEVQQTVRRLAKGHRPGRHPRRGGPGQALGDEQKAFTQFWTDVAALLKKANAPPSLASLMQQLPEARKALPKDSPQLAGLLAQIGLGLLEQKKWTEAEPLLRECLAIREQTQPDVWSTFNTKSTLGGALPGPEEICRRRAAAPDRLRGYEAAGEDDPGAGQDTPARSRGAPGATLRCDRQEGRGGKVAEGVGGDQGGVEQSGGEAPIAPVSRGARSISRERPCSS